MKKYFNICINIILWILIIIATCITIVSLNTKKHGITEIDGIIPITIENNNMSPTIKEKDLIFTIKYNKKSKLNKGDIITFLTFKDNKTILETHRINQVISDGGLISYQTKGDNALLKDDKILSPTDIISVFKGIRIPFLGRVLEILRSKFVFFTFIILPLFLTMAYFTYDLFSKDKKEEDIKD